MYSFLLILTVASAATFQGWRTLINNFAVEVAALNGYQMGVVQSIREIPGFLALLVVYMLLIFSEHTLAALSVLVLGFGVIATGFFPTFLGITLATLAMSFGFHYYETLNQSLTLQYFDRVRAPLVFGRLRALSAMVNIATGLVLFVLIKFLNFKAMFLLVGAFAVLLGLWSLRDDPSDKQLPLQHKKMVFRKRYWLFYCLTLMAGARRQIFIAFAVYLLVDRFGYSVQTVTILFMVNNAVNYFASPLIAKAINRFGERKTLTVEYLGLVGVFLVYAFTSSKPMVAAMYVLDHLLFNFAIAIRTYFQKIADPSDIAPSMAVGFTINHIAAVIIPFVGGILWMVDYKIPFIAGAVMSGVSLTLVQFIRTEEPKPL
jgi:Major Facilitator Superfamily